MRCKSGVACAGSIDLQRCHDVGIVILGGHYGRTVGQVIADDSQGKTEGKAGQKYPSVGGFEGAEQAAIAVVDMDRPAFLGRVVEFMHGKG